QIYYRLVGRDVLPKTEKAYNGLRTTLVEARRAGRVPFDSIRDDGGVEHPPRCTTDELLNYLQDDDEKTPEFIARIRDDELTQAIDTYNSFWDRVQDEYDGFWDRFWENREYDAVSSRQTRFDPLANQPRRVEVWVESKGMVPLIRRAVTQEYDNYFPSP